MHHFFAWKWLLSMVLLCLFLQNYPAVAAAIAAAQDDEAAKKPKAE